MPSLSVIIPNKNYGKYLPECLDSVLNQTVRPLEILIDDGKSSDNSIDVIRRYSEKSDLIRWTQSGLNVNRSIEFLISKAKGDYIYFLGSDDFIPPHSLESFLNHNSCVIYSNLYHLWLSGLISEWKVPDFNASLLQKVNYVSLNACIIKRECLERTREKYGYILDDRAGIVSDWELMLRLMESNCTFKHEKLPLVYFRKHRVQNSSHLKLAWDIYKVYRKRNRVSVKYLTATLVFGTLIQLLRLYRMNVFSDNALAKIVYRKVWYF
jgi:glycosyltransferase involved in cell wall biosynthesis